MITVRDIVLKQREQLEKKETARQITAGLLVSVNGSVTVPRRPNYVYFLEYNQPENGPPAVVWNDVVAPIDQLPVLVALEPKKPFKRKVIGVNTDALIQTDPTQSGWFNLPPHAQTHQWPDEVSPGHDKLPIYQPALQMLKSTGGNGLIVSVNRLIHQFAGNRFVFPGGTVDVTSHIPAGPTEKLRLLIYLDQISNSLNVVTGATVPDIASVVAPYPAIPDNSIASAYLLLRDTTTAVLNTDFEDARAFLTTGGTSGGSGSTLTPRRVGDFLVSLDGTTFVPQEILVDSWGEIITDSNGHFVTI